MDRVRAIRDGVPGSGTPDPTPTTTPDLPAGVSRDLAMSADWISSWWTALALALAAGAVAVWLLGRRRTWRARGRPAGSSRGRGRETWSGRSATAGGVAGVVVLSLATGLVAANAVSGYVPGVGALVPTLRGWGVLAPSDARWNPRQSAGDGEHGAVRTVDIPAAATERMAAGPAWVYTPPGFDPTSDVRYPVVYLVHGSPGRPSDFFAAADAGRAMDSLIAHDVVGPMILVSLDVNGTGPSARDTECLDSTTGGSLVETYVTTTAIAWVDAHLPTIADREHRVVGGASSGGFCALNLGLRHTDLYSVILGLMPYADPGSGGEAMLSTPEEIAANSPSGYIPTMDFAGPVGVFLDTGTLAGQEARTRDRELAALLTARGQRVELREEPGQGHTWAMVKVGLPYALRFAGRIVAPPTPAPIP